MNLPRGRMSNDLSDQAEKLLQYQLTLARVEWCLMKAGNQVNKA